jgi:hypothetical protein
MEKSEKVNGLIEAREIIEKIAGNSIQFDPTIKEIYNSLNSRIRELDSTILFKSFGPTVTTTLPYREKYIG